MNKGAFGGVAAHKSEDRHDQRGMKQCETNMKHGSTLITLPRILNHFISSSHIILC